MDALKPTRKQDTLASAVYGANNKSGHMIYDAAYHQTNNDIKSATIDGRMVPGNMKLMNGDITMRVKSRDDVMKNNRSNVATPTTPQTPSVNNMGRLQGGDTLYKNIQMDRNTADITETLKGNPYALQYKFNTNGSS
jgi:hypothetical protein